MSDNETPGMGGARAMMLNPAAGTHPVTSDPREVSAASRAGNRSFHEFPYYQARYGDRGRLFALSDGAWIVTLCANPDTKAIIAEVAWLAQVLASRGMPSLLMEKHLEFMEEELTSAVPARADEYRKLGIARRELRTRRSATIPDAEFDRLVADFERQTDPRSSAELPRMGSLLVTAAADEAAGVTRAVSSLLDWVADPTRFSEQWIRAVETTVEGARAVAEQSGGALPA